MIVLCQNRQCGFCDISTGMCTRGVIEIEAGSGICKYLRNPHCIKPVDDDCKVKEKIIVLGKHIDTPEEIARKEAEKAAKELESAKKLIERTGPEGNSEQ